MKKQKERKRKWKERKRKTEITKTKYISEKWEENGRCENFLRYIYILRFHVILLFKSICLFFDIGYWMREKVEIDFLLWIDHVIWIIEKHEIYIFLKDALFWFVCERDKNLRNFFFFLIINRYIGLNWLIDWIEWWIGFVFLNLTCDVCFCGFLCDEKIIIERERKRLCCLSVG